MLSSGIENHEALAMEKKGAKGYLFFKKKRLFKGKAKPFQNFKGVVQEDFILFKYEANFKKNTFLTLMALANPILPDYSYPMKTLLILLLSFYLAPETKGQTRSLQDSMRPSHYLKRELPELNIALGYYGRFWKIQDLERIKELLEKRFLEATDGAVKVKVDYMEVLDFQHQIANHPDYTNGNITDPERLQRLWYFDNFGGKVLLEIYEQFKKTELGRGRFSHLDALLVITGAQFEALGFASGRVGVTEQPREVAWGLPSGGRVDVISDEQIVDELIHELGHIMFLGHTSTQCQKPGMSHEEKKECCKTSPSRNDVMSYCRNRANVDESFFHLFEACNLKMIKQKILPALLAGGSQRISNRTRCK